jgi:hypothetical protein
VLKEFQAYRMRKVRTPRQGNDQYDSHYFNDELFIVVIIHSLCFLLIFADGARFEQAKAGNFALYSIIYGLTPRPSVYTLTFCGLPFIPLPCYRLGLIRLPLLCSLLRANPS